MSKSQRPIEEFFLESLLLIGLIAITIVMSVDFYFTKFVIARSLIIDFAILFAITTSFIFYKLGQFALAVLWIGFIIMAAMFYQSIKADTITTSSMAVIMVIGFCFSVLLKNSISMVCHAITFTGMILVFGWQIAHPQLYGKSNANDIIVAGVTYCILYIVISYSSLLLKNRYNEMIKSLDSKNNELIEQANEIETQNEELIQSQENLYQLNLHLESIVQVRTHEVKKQNEQLLSYAYSNAHHLRGQVARVLGLIQLAKIDTDLDYPFLFQHIEEQAIEIDEVVKSINKELESEADNV